MTFDYRSKCGLNAIIFEFDAKKQAVGESREFFDTVRIPAKADSHVTLSG